MAQLSDGARGRRTPFADPDLLTGSSRPWVYMLVLIVTGGADVAAFYQVVALIMTDSSTWLVYLMVIGLAGAALSLAHLSGGALRCSAEHVRRPHSTRQAAVLLASWLLLGLAAFWVRLVAGGSDQGEAAFGQRNAAGPTPHQAALKALLFLALYLGSGLIASVSAYRAHNPVALSYGRARLAQQQAAAIVRRTGPLLVRAEHEHRQQLDERERDERRWRSAREERLEWAEELKRYARVLMATHLGDPPATDGLTDPDSRPALLPPRHGIHLVDPNGTQEAAG